ncbi:MAG: SNF2-related protein [archaeon]
MSQTSLFEFSNKSLLPQIIQESEQEIIKEVKQERKILRIEPSGKTYTQLNTEIKLSIHNETWHKDDLIKYYEGLGIEIKSENGILGLHNAREKNLGQFFTPLWASKLIVELLSIPCNATVLDNSMGSGRLAWHLPNKKLFTGIEYEAQAYEVAKRVYPDSCIIQDNLVNHVADNRFDYVLINPPFSLNLKSLHGNLIHISYGGGVLSQVAAMEIGLRAVKDRGYLAAILPENVWKLESTRVLHRWIKENSQEIARIRLPKSTFIGTEWRTTLFIFHKTSWNSDSTVEPFTDELSSEQDTPLVIGRFQQTVFNRDVIDYSVSRNSREPVILEKLSKAEEAIQSINKRKLSWNSENPRVLVTSVKNRLHFMPNNALAAIKMENIKANFQVEYDYSLRDYADTLKKSLVLDKVWIGEKHIHELEIFTYFEKYGLDYEISPVLVNWLKKKKRFYNRESLAFEQWIKPTEESDWECRFDEDGIKTILGLYNHRQRIFRRCCKEFPHLNVLYDFQKDDLIRLSLKKSAIIAWQQGLGKTKLGIALAILKDCKKNLFIVPSHLKATWVKEFKNFGINAHIIEEKADISQLSMFNLITFNALKKKVDSRKTKFRTDKRSGKAVDKAKTFADILRKKFKFVIVDEAHYLSNKSTSQTKAVSKMKPRYWYLMTGTPIGNTVKNIYSLLDIGWKAGSPFFPYNTKQFREEFVTVEWVTPEFDDTLSKGRTAQQMADVKNVEVFVDLMKAKWLRRVKAEPEVQRCIAIPKPHIVDVQCKPEQEQLIHYKKHLEEFAVIFKRYMHPEEDKEHKVDQSIVLAMIQNLQFCSIIPQHPKVNPDEDFTYKGDKTTTQKKILELIKAHYAEGRKIILFTQRPDFCDLLGDWLKKENIESVVFTGKINIDKRNKRLDDFKYNGINVMLASINVTDTGLNIPQANIAIIAEADWKWSKIDQAYSRILRPQTKESPTVYCIHTNGTIDNYLWQHAYRKKDAIDEALEGREDIKKEKWVHWKDFIVEMLEQEGLWP